MPQTYNGSLTGIVAREQAAISEPVGTDQRNAASVQTPFRKLADYVQYLMQKAGVLDAVSTWTAKQTFAAVDINPGAGALEISAGGSGVRLLQANGVLEVGTKAGNASSTQIMVEGAAVVSCQKDTGSPSNRAAIGGFLGLLAVPPGVEGTQNGDVWFDGGALKVRIGGVVKTITVT